MQEKGVSQIKALQCVKCPGVISRLFDVAEKIHTQLQNDLLRDHVVQFPHFLQQGGSEKMNLPSAPLVSAPSNCPLGILFFHPLHI